jgi:glutaredoxin
MTEIMLFSKPGCRDCDYVKAHIPAGVKVALLDTSTAIGMAEAAYYEVRTVPALVVDERMIIGTVNIMNKLNELSPPE